MKKAVLFGAGNIGRGFIGELLHDSGYEITFIDTFKGIVDQINQNGGYKLYLIEEDYKEIVIDNCHAVSSIEDPDAAVAAIADADVITTAVLVNNLPKIAPTLLAGLKARAEAGKERINIFACENAIDNSQILKQAVIDLDAEFATKLDDVAAFANTAVDRIVQPRERDGVRTIDIGEFHELCIDKTQMVDPDSEPIKGAEYTDALSYFIERKLFIINAGHCWAGFIGSLYGYDTITAVFRDEKLAPYLRAMMNESAGCLVAKGSFTKQEMDEYIDVVMSRWSAKGLGDPISRVCRSPIRKLGHDERMVSPALQCEERGLPNKMLLKGIAAGYLFDLPSDEESVELQAYIKENGIEDAITNFSGLEAGTPVYDEILADYRAFASGDLSLD